MTEHPSGMVLRESEAIVICYAIDHGTSMIKEVSGDHSLPEWLALEANKTIYKAIETLEKQGGVILNAREVHDHLCREGNLSCVNPSFRDAIAQSASAIAPIVTQELEKLRVAYIKRSQSRVLERAMREGWSPSVIRDSLEPLVALHESGRSGGILDGINVINAADLIDRSIDEGQTLLGNRFLCRGGGLFLVGPSGVGKSTLTLGLAAPWAAGYEALGIKPVKPLKILIVQAENDEGDVIEQMRGAYGADREGISNLLICPVGHLIGAELIEALDRLIKQNKPDLVVLDCLHAYLGDDAKESKSLGVFLRQLLNPVIKRHEVGVLIVHHTPKTTNQDRSNWIPSDYQYAAAGAAEIANWTRAMLVLEATDVNGVFRLVAAKRGSRIGSDVWNDGWIPIRHSEGKDDGRPVLKWEIAKGIDLATIQRAAKERRAAKQSYQCSAGDFIAQLPDSGDGQKSCMKSGDLRGILQQKRYCSKDGFGGLKATYAQEGIIKTLKVGTTEWVGRPEDIDQMEREVKA